MTTLANTPASPEDAFLREVDEEFRRSQLMGLWQRFGMLAIALLVLALGALAFWLYWQDRQQQAAGDAGAALTRAMEQMDVGEGARARPVLEAMTRDGPGAYSGLARMVLANDALAGGDKAKARGLYQAVASDTALPQPLRDAALVKAVRVGFDEMRPADVVAKLKPLAVPGNAWFGVAGELVAVAHFKAGKPELAKPILIAMVKDEGLSPSLRSRAAQLAIAAGVDIATLGLNAQPAQ
ncbi:tetratricopeptide repeat protein [Sandarakinorhabdus oryzae]|uniref:tetratricopeptide repeat protein n=1 Tax=Sandarakinorhabdus oryzae TaxID=2675220 RepID=UPI0018CC61FA|nr:tetratricopeptide repeat protein [Sandarakinorhabdus oryzae]